MSVEIWPHVASDRLKAAIETAEKRELEWFVQDLQETLTNLRHGLEDCYALLAPIDPGNTLVLSTPRHEFVKGHVTRVGTRIVKGTIHLRLRTLPHQTLTINPDHPIHLAPLTALHALLSHSIDLLNLTLSYYPSPSTTPSATTNSQPPPSPPTTESIPPPPPQFLSAQLRLLSQSLSEASSFLKGPQPLTAPDPSWTTASAAASHFSPPLAQPHPSDPTPSLSFHLSIQDSSLVLSLRSLEPAYAPVHFGTKLALAIGTARRLEHDEADTIFRYCCTYHGDSEPDIGQRRGSSPPLFNSNSNSIGVPLSGTRSKSKDTTKPPKSVDVFVREKVRVESADPSLLSLSAKLAALGHTLAQARRNLAAVMGEEWEGED
ncbi:RAVE subunit 2/Rogdi [Chaetomium strumarium]|uniref:RAVE subunit 2/Rogdi n=1 Tax=Chaetomium strumarium TaxID=1170767 RepID=A0AAJ0M789_9PEZI|nr:RAVE subunit 2/Rogdi [Chaetomium strumarium]